MSYDAVPGNCSFLNGLYPNFINLSAPLRYFIATLQQSFQGLVTFPESLMCLVDHLSFFEYWALLKWLRF
jgi:hypothetical protein